jgi:predicted extracellular nuclease
MATSRTAPGRRFLPAILAIALIVPLVFSLGSARAAPTELFFSEYIEGTSNNKALEIFNGTGAPIDLAANGYSIQMFFNGSGAAGLTIGLTGTVAAGDVYVVAHSAASPTILAQADQTSGAGWFNGDDAVLLLKGATVIDSIGERGFDPGTEWGTGLTSTADNTLRRKSAIEAGDPDPNDVFDPAVQWDGFATDDFTGLGAHVVSTDAAPQVSSTTPAAGATNVTVDSNVTVTFSEPVTVSGSWFSISCTTSGAHAAAASGGPVTFTLDPSADFVQDETCTVTIVGAQVSDNDADDPPDTMTGNAMWSFTTVGPPARIHDIQGAAHRSPLEGHAVSSVPGIVTAKVSNGFFFEDPNPDASSATSEGLFVFGTAAAGAVAVGDAVEVAGFVTEFRPGDATGSNLTQTELTSPEVEVLSSGNALPGPGLIGKRGRIPPDEIIDNDSTGDAEVGGVFDPAQDGLDFYESLESMRVRVNNAWVVGPTNAFDEIPIVGDNAERAGIMTNRGGVVIRAKDFNPERIHLDNRLMPVPALNVGDRFTTPVVGIVDYSFANFKLDVSEPFATVSGGLEREVASDVGADELSVATFNVENLDPNDDAAKFARLAALIVNNLKSPDIVALEEIQDNNGPVNDAVTDASLTLTTLIAAIQAAGGPLYDFRQIDPVDDQDGGEPGGNIRVGFIFRTDRGLSFVDRPGGTSTAATGVVAGPDGPQLTFSPGRVDPTNPAFTNSRKPLAAEFRWRGETIFAIANHFNSKGGDDPLFGRFQPPNRVTETQRHQQAQVVNSFVDSILALDANAKVLVLGDLNDFEFSETLAILEGGVLDNLVLSLRRPERYTYVFEGNSQVLDHILASRKLYRTLAAYDIVHVNAEFADQASDHDPQVARFDLGG